MIIAAVRSLPAWLIGRIVSAACALVITSVLVLAIGLGFSAPARADMPDRAAPESLASSPLKTGFVDGRAAEERGRQRVA